MEDSGFDSGDRVVNFMVGKIRKIDFALWNMVEIFCLQQNYQNHLGSSNLGDESSTSNEEEILDVKHLRKSMASNSDNIDNVGFRNPSIINPSTTKTQVLIDQSKSHHLNEHNKKLSNINTCKSLHRKLEQKVERAKKNFLHNEKFNQLENDAVSFSFSFPLTLFRCLSFFVVYMNVIHKWHIFPSLDYSSWLEFDIFRSKSDFISNLICIHLRRKNWSGCFPDFNANLVDIHLKFAFKYEICLKN